MLVGGLAMGYYGLRKSGKDVDFIIDQDDHKKLKKHFEKKELKIRTKNHRQSYKTTPEFVDLNGDQGILIFEFEIWNQIRKFDYAFFIRRLN